MMMTNKGGVSGCPQVISLPAHLFYLLKSFNRCFNLATPISGEQST